MSYSRSCGVSLAACGAQTCQCVSKNRAIATNLRYNENAPGGAGNTLRGLTRSLDYTKEGLMPNSTCVIDDCSSPTRTRGLCVSHYSYHRQAGTLEDVALPPKKNGGPSPRRYPPGTRLLRRDGYVKVADADGILHFEHRHVMAMELGRPLAPGENVHHINGDRADNRVENLELWYSPQPYGQRVEQLIEYLIEFHQPRLLDALVPRVQRSDAELLAEQYADLLAEHTHDNPLQTAHNQSREGA